MSSWFDKHFSRKDLKTSLLVVAIIAFIGWVWSKVGDGTIAQWLDIAFAAISDWIIAAWTFCVNAAKAAITYVTGPIEISRWVFVVLLIFAIIPLIIVLVRKLRAGSFRDVFGEAYQYMTEMTIGNFVRTTFDVKYAQEHHRRWKESRLSVESATGNDEQADPESGEGDVAEVGVTLADKVLAVAAYLRNAGIPTFAAIDISGPIQEELLVVEREIEVLERSGMIESAGYTTKGEEYVLTNNGRNYVLDSDLLNNPALQF